MIIALPHLTVTEYLRSFFLGNLVVLCARPCPLYGHCIRIIGLRLRLTLDIPVYRGRCTSDRCKTCFTFLPIFAAPAKWYGYAQIGEVLAFLAHRPTTLNTALTEYETARDNRIEDGAPAGPSVSTIRRWWREFSEASTNPAWLAHAAALTGADSREVRPDLNEEPLPEALSSKSSPAPSSRRYARSSPAAKSAQSSPAHFLAFLLHLATMLLSAPAPVSLLGLGIGVLESRIGRRFLASPALAGRVTPSPSPDPAETVRPLLIYDPEPP